MWSIPNLLKMVCLQSRESLKKLQSLFTLVFTYSCDCEGSHLEIVLHITVTALIGSEGVL